MKTWNQFLEDKQNEMAARSATMNPQDVQSYAQGNRPMTPPMGTMRKPPTATLNLDPAQQAAGAQAYQQARNPLTAQAMAQQPRRVRV